MDTQLAAFQLTQLPANRRQEVVSHFGTSPAFFGLLNCCIYIGSGFSRYSIALHSHIVTTLASKHQALNIDIDKLIGAQRRVIDLSPRLLLVFCSIVFGLLKQLFNICVFELVEKIAIGMVLDFVAQRA